MSREKRNSRTVRAERNKRTDRKVRNSRAHSVKKRKAPSVGAFCRGCAAGIGYQSPRMNFVTK